MSVINYHRKTLTLVYSFDLSILKIHLLAKNEVRMSRLSKVRARTGQIDRHTFGFCDLDIDLDPMTLVYKLDQRRRQDLVRQGH